MTYRTQLLFCFLAFAFVAPAQAVNLPPASSVLLSGTTSAARPELAGTVIADVIRPLSIDLGAAKFFNGTLQDRVVREDATGTLDFYYKLTSSADPGIHVDYITREDFSGWTTDVDFRTDGDGTVGIDRVGRIPSGAQLLFDFTPADHNLQPGQETRFFFAKTNAKAFSPGKGALAIGGVGSNVVTLEFESFQPAVPEPGTLAMLVPVALAGACRCWPRRRMCR